MRTSIPYADVERGRRRPLRWVDGWSLAALALALAVALPVLVVAASLTQPAGDIWSHLARTVLGDYVVNTVLLAVGVGIGVTLIGVGTAWLVTMCHVPSRGILEWALLLPLAVPTYIIGYTYTDLLQYAGPVQTTLREVMGWSRARLLVSADPIARRRDHGHDPGALPLRLPAGARRLPRAVHLHDRRQPDARARPLGQLHRRRRAARPAGDRRRRGAGADGGPGRFRHRAVLRRQHLHHRDLPHLVLARRAGRGGAAGGRPDDGRLPGPGARAALSRPGPLPAHGALAPAPLLPAEPRRARSWRCSPAWRRSRSASACRWWSSCT